ncbi:Fanconi anemia group B protein [Xyrichtys novacula]|uniref:Fanconi anemia group B protein n=1 Tax=Xyrichtys novacula TaxID=13765 RepID=A0AAV1H210_XYRNO|nr:Fanconi anemia group B protein [Xyrichtys novacula]
MEELLPEDVYRLSHCGKITSFNCQRLPGVNGGEKSELIFSCVSFDRQEKRYVKAAEGAAVLGGRNATNVNVVKCKCVINVQKRVAEPCVLVWKKKNKGESFHYSLLTLSSTNKLEPCIEFKLPYQMEENVSILHGPTVMWIHTGQVFYTSPQAGEVRRIPIQLSHCVFGELPLLNERLFILGQNISGKSSSHHPTRQTLGYLVESGHVFDGSMILPFPYICITLCILVLSAEKEENTLKSAVVAATSNKQLVYLENGMVRETCQLPFEQAENIQVVNTGRNGCLFVVTFSQGHVCTIWRETFQVASHWSGVSSVHVDDFVGCGTDQMLLVFGDQGISGQPLENFLLTDLCGIAYADCPENRAPRTPLPPETHLLTLQALESRLQSGLTVLQEFQREERVKERVLQQSLQALAAAVSERESVVISPEQEGLVALWDCDDESKDEGSDDKKHDMPAVSSKPQVDKLWHCIAEDRMVVGVILTTDISVPVADVSLSILTATGQSSTLSVIQTQSQVFWLPAPYFSSSSPILSSSASNFPEPAAKRSRQHSASRPSDLNTCRLAVTAATALTPLLNSGCVNCRVVLHYIQRRDAFALVSNQTQAVLDCGDIALDIHSEPPTQLLKNPELKTDEVLEDFLSLRTVLDHWVFCVDSPEHSLGDIDGWIQRREGCKRIEVHPQYLLINSAGTSAPMLLHWRQITPFQGELSVHSRQLPMLQFLDSLLAHLPMSSSIQPIKGTTGQEAAQIFSLALEKEAVALRECVSSLLCEEEGGEEEEEKKRSFGEEKGPDLCSAGGLLKVREMWQQDVERSRMKLSPLVDVGRYRKLTQNMFKVQLEADLAALLDTQGTLLS